MYEVSKTDLILHFYKFSFFQFIQISSLCGKGVLKLRKQTAKEFLLRISGFKASNVSGSSVIIQSESS